MRIGYSISFYVIILCMSVITSCVGGKRPSSVVPPQPVSKPTTVLPPQEVAQEISIEHDIQHHIGSLEIPQIITSREEQIIMHKGYTVSYNECTRVANWVAYELTVEEVQGTVPRGKKFTQDPLARGRQADNDDYRNSGWDRGHMCPAGDMKWDKQAMDESFYFTNICPQHPNLNGGDWKDLEEKCRELALLYQRVYIVCGAIVGNAINGTIGYNKVTIPDAFYKVLLVKTNTEFEGIGFIFENNSGGKPLSKYARSIDEVEATTGMDFFHALPNDIEDNVESNYNLRIWHIK